MCKRIPNDASRRSEGNSVILVSKGKFDYCGGWCSQTYPYGAITPHLEKSLIKGGM